MIGQGVGALGTLAAVGVALWLAQLEHRREVVERRDREAARARLVIITVDYSEYENPRDYEYAMARVVISNHREQRVLRPEVEQMRGARPPVHWGSKVYTGEVQPLYSPPEVLLPLERHSVPFEHVSADGRIVDPAEASAVYTAVKEIDNAGNIHVTPKIAAAGKVEDWIDVEDAIITFIDMSGLRWRRTGNGEPVRVVRPAPKAE